MVLPSGRSRIQTMPSKPPLHRSAAVPTAAPYDRERGSAASRGYDRLWQKFRAQILAERPLCQDCLAAGRVTPSREVHHVVKLRARRDLRLDPENVLALCTPCHSARTARGE